MKLLLSDFDAVAFDFDGTLANTLPIHAAGERYAYAKHGLNGITEEHHRIGHLHGTTSTTIIAGVLKEAKHIPPDADPYSHELVMRLVKTKDEYHHQMALSGFDQHPGATELYKRMVEHKGADHVSIVTNAAFDDVVQFTHRYDIAKHLTRERIISIETIEYNKLSPKPSCDAYVLAAERMGVHPSRLLVIEDSIEGVASGKRADSLVLATSTTNTEAALYDFALEYHPDFFVETFAEVELIA